VERQVSCHLYERSRLAADRVWLDGELVVMLTEGISCFGSLQQAVATRDQACLAYYPFDLLYLDGRDLCRVPLERRKEMLFEMIGEGEWNLRAIDHIRGHGPEFFLAACKQRLEGIISKKADSCYRPGIRSKEWLKVKCRGYAETRDVRWEWWKK
jgi:bifunctional non-homologous end joining protein LigD